MLNELGAGFLESVYEKALALVLIEKGLKVEAQKAIKVIFRNKVVGDFYADLLVNDKVLVELKTVKNLIPAHEAQVINYLKATGIEVGILVNFGNPTMDYRRLSRNHQK